MGFAKAFAKKCCGDANAISEWNDPGVPGAPDFGAMGLGWSGPDVARGADAIGPDCAGRVSPDCMPMQINSRESPGLENTKPSFCLDTGKVQAGTKEVLMRLPNSQPTP